VFGVWWVLLTSSRCLRWSGGVCGCFLLVCVIVVVLCVLLTCIWCCVLFISRGCGECVMGICTVTRFLSWLLGLGL